MNAATSKPPSSVCSAVISPPSICTRSRIPSTPCPAPGDGLASRLGAPLTIRTPSPPSTYEISTRASAPGECRSALLSPSCTIRYADSSTPCGSGRGEPVTTASTTSPALRTLSSSESRLPSVGCGASGSLSTKASGSAERTTPRMRRSSARAATAFSRMVAKDVASSGGVSLTR